MSWSGFGLSLVYSHNNDLFVFVVSVSDVEAVREGHQSEVLLSIADEFPPDRCFTLVFRGRRGNLDLVAESAEEAQSWIKGIRKLIDNLENMGQREKLDQYPLLYLPVYRSLSYAHKGSQSVKSITQEPVLNLSVCKCSLPMNSMFLDQLTTLKP